MGHQLQFETVVRRAVAIQQHYRRLNLQEGRSPWSLSEYMQGFVGDVGALAKLVMAKGNYRDADEHLDSRLGHELADCLWSVIILANELEIDLPQAFTSTMDRLELQIANTLE